MSGPWENYATSEAPAGPWSRYAAPETKADPGEEKRSLVDQFARQLGLTGRYMIEGAAGLPLMLGDAANTAVNAGIDATNRVAGTNINPLPMPSQVTQGAMSGLPKPETGLERVIGEASKAVASVPTLAAGAAASGSRTLAPLTENMGQQLTAAAGAGAGAGAGREAFPGSPTAEIVGGLAGGLAGGVRTGVNPERVARLRDFEQAGISPSVPDVTQSQTAQRTQKVTEAVPFSGVKGRERERLAEAGKASDEIASGYGTPSNPNEMGSRAQTAVENYRFGSRPEGMSDREVLIQPTRNTSLKEKASAAYNKVPVDDAGIVPATETSNALKAVANRFDNQDLSANMANRRLVEWSKILDDAKGELSWSDIRNLRTEVRYLRGQSKLDPTIDDRALGQLDDALSKDMLSGARQLGGDRAAELVQRADKYYALSMQRIDNGLKQIYRVDRPEAAFNQIESALSAKPGKGDLQKLQSLRRVMTDEDWGDLSATVIDRLGRPTPGATAAPGQPNFSAAQFVTRYNDMSPQARQLLFDGANRGELRNRLDALAKATGNMKATDRLSNSSQSGNQLIGAGIMGGAMVEPMTAAGVVLGSNLTARALYNPAFVRLMTQTISAGSPQAQAAVAQQVTRFASQNPDLAAEANGLLRALSPRPAADTEATSTAP